MFRHFQPFIDYAKLIERDANQVNYRLSKNETKSLYKNTVSTKNTKTKKIGRK